MRAARWSLVVLAGCALVEMEWRLFERLTGLDNWLLSEAPSWAYEASWHLLATGFGLLAGAVTWFAFNRLERDPLVFSVLLLVGIGARHLAASLFEGLWPDSTVAFVLSEFLSPLIGVWMALAVWQYWRERRIKLQRSCMARAVRWSAIGLAGIMLVELRWTVTHWLSRPYDEFIPEAWLRADATWIFVASLLGLCLGTAAWLSLKRLERDPLVFLALLLLGIESRYLLGAMRGGFIHLDPSAASIVAAVAMPLVGVWIGVAACQWRAGLPSVQTEPLPPVYQAHRADGARYTDLRVAARGSCATTLARTEGTT